MADFDWGAVRAQQAAAGCTFRPRSGGGWSHTCTETATRIKRTTVRHGSDQRRCERHYKVDVRTATNRNDRWSLDDLAKYEAFDADAAKGAALAEYRAAKVAKANAFWTEAADLVAARDIVGLRAHVTGR